MGRKHLFKFGDYYCLMMSEILVKKKGQPSASKTYFKGLSKDERMIFVLIEMFKYHNNFEKLVFDKKNHKKIEKKKIS